MTEFLLLIYKLIFEQLITNSFISYLIFYIFQFQIDHNFLFEILLNKRLIVFFIKKLYDRKSSKKSLEPNLVNKTEIELLSSQGMIYTRISSSNLKTEDLKEIIKEVINNNK